MNGALLASAVAAIALLCAAIFSQRGTAVGVAVTYLVVNFFVCTIAEWWPVASPLGPYTPFWYVDGPAIFKELAWPASDMTVLISIIIAAAVAGGIVWRKRDLPL